MAKEKIKLSNEVSDFLNNQNHPLRKEIEQLRNIILTADMDLSENIKWNSPNYCYHNPDGYRDLITMKIQPPKQIQLIFHRGAKKLAQPKEKIIQTNSKLLSWRENDRAIASFKSAAEIKNAEVELTEIVQNWIKATK